MVAWCNIALLRRKVYNISALRMVSLTLWVNCFTRCCMELVIQSVSSPGSPLLPTHCSAHGVRWLDGTWTYTPTLAVLANAREQPVLSKVKTKWILSQNYSRYLECYMFIAQLLFFTVVLYFGFGEIKYPGK